MLLVQWKIFKNNNSIKRNRKYLFIYHDDLFINSSMTSSIFNLSCNFENLDYMKRIFISYLCI